MCSSPLGCNLGEHGFPPGAGMDVLYEITPVCHEVMTFDGGVVPFFGVPSSDRSLGFKPRGRTPNPQNPTGCAAPVVTANVIGMGRCDRRGGDFKDPLTNELAAWPIVFLRDVWGLLVLGISDVLCVGVGFRNEISPVDTPRVNEEDDLYQLPLLTQSASHIEGSTK